MIVRRDGRLALLESAPSTCIDCPVIVENARATLLRTGVALLERLVGASPPVYVLVVRNDLASAAAIVAAAESKHVVVLLPASRLHLLEYTIAQTGAALVVDATVGTVTTTTTTTYRPQWPCEAFGSDGGVCMLTSGSTGTSKVVACAWPSMYAQGDATQAAMFPTRPCRFVLASSIAHAYAINALFAILTSAHGDTSTLVMSSRMDALVPVLSTPAPSAVTIVFGTPGTYAPLLQGSKPVPLFADLAYSAGVTLPTEMHTALRRDFGLFLVQNYGSTETGGIAAGGIRPGVAPPTHLRLPNAGALWPGALVRVQKPSTGMVCRDGEDGELVVQTPWQCAGYVEQKTLVRISADGFYQTSDGGAVVQGHVFVGDRLRAPVRCRAGHFTVFVPRHEIEDAVLQHPAISDALVPVVDASPETVVLLVVTSLPLQEAEKVCRSLLPSFVSTVDIRKVEHLACSAAGKLLYSIPE
ncbi:hypothetical protein SPRG_13737 [Saprolegnia parasitica CBS 223.65]|uniref:AMP-dependent synthetase/ligase domain-containing protein n=1 Tax=Saprolegnia parasitica (strain CBS 223.65) TaxID=695850 RepID=A0A067BSM4_SAPPC|nr:hypothetical protein SPRG_13737 [Saprolegnia parasitica CBS 223.65]KDO21238.1 hypothetical protein SPRG_13737 [Saprolegnia parasitica CBS 223.65]|eukprot:XP_012208070.1 hypothetical protein SPRG_13737 [Saprolegnia parasitica CBS 223.65]